MPTTLFRNIGLLVNTRDENQPLRKAALAELPSMEHAYLLVEDQQIADFGKMEDLPSSYSSSGTVIDCSGKFILPAWCDSHSHLVFAGSREEEFVDKIKGISYAEIAARGGGILQSAKAVHDTTEDELFNQ